MHRSSFKSELSAGLHQIPIYDKARLLTKPHSGLLAKLNQKARRRARADQVSYEYG